MFKTGHYLTTRASRASWWHWRCQRRCRQSNRGHQGWRQRAPTPSWNELQCSKLANSKLETLMVWDQVGMEWSRSGRRLTRRKCWGLLCCRQRGRAWYSQPLWPRFPSASGGRRGCTRRRRWWGSCGGMEGSLQAPGSWIVLSFSLREPWFSNIYAASKWRRNDHLCIWFQLWWIYLCSWNHFLCCPHLNMVTRTAQSLKSGDSKNYFIW